LSMFRARSPPSLLSFPTRRSSDLTTLAGHPALPPPAAVARRLVRPGGPGAGGAADAAVAAGVERVERDLALAQPVEDGVLGPARSEEHTSELQSRSDLVCRLLLEK